jgi:hypothetical protein
VVEMPAPPPPPEPAPVVEIPVTVADAGLLSDAGSPDAGPEVVEDPGPTGPLGMCQRDIDCLGDLLCREGSRATPGYCTESCTSDGDCGELGAVCMRTAFPGVCVLPCNGPGDVCPGEMACQKVIGATSRCAYPPPPLVGLFEPCSVNANNCQEGGYCYQATDSELPGPGYCAPTGCQRDSDCDAHQPAGATAPLRCSGNVCRLDCESGTCPDGMQCEYITPEDSDPYSRCAYPE